MNWNSTATTDNAKNTIWSERCTKEHKCVKALPIWRVNPQYLQRSMLSEQVATRPQRFLRGRMQEAIDFGHSMDRRAHTTMSNYKSEISEVEGDQTKEEVKSWLRRMKQKPEEKYAQPLTSGQEYGWGCQPESRLLLPHHRHTKKPRSMCDVTRIANQMLAASGGGQ